MDPTTTGTTPYPLERGPGATAAEPLAAGAAPAPRGEAVSNEADTTKGPREIPRSPDGAARALAGDDVNAHTLTLVFHRFLSQDEWREVVEAAQRLPYVQELRADSVRESPHDDPPRCPRCGYTQAWHCIYDEPGLDHDAACAKMHHEFTPAPPQCP